MESASEFSVEFLFGKKIPKEQNFLIIEDINAKGELILLKLIQEYILDNFKTVLVILEPIPHCLLEELAIKESENFSIVNTYSTSCSRYYSSIKLHELNLTLKALRKELKSDRKLIIAYWSLDSLFINYSSNDVIQFYLENVKHASDNNTIEFYLVGKGIVEEMVMRRLISIAHCVLELQKSQSLDDLCNISYLKTIELDVKKNKPHFKYKIESPLWNSKIWFIDHL